MTLDLAVEYQDIPSFSGPILATSPASCAIGFPHAEELSHVACLGGEAEADLLIRASDGWFRISRSGLGRTAACKDFMKLLRHSDRKHSALAVQALALAHSLGYRIEPGAIDILFAEELPLSQRLLLFSTASLASKKRVPSSRGLYSLFSKGEPQEEEQRTFPSFLDSIHEKKRQDLFSWLTKLQDLEHYGALYASILKLLSLLKEEPLFPQLPRLTSDDLALAHGVRSGLSATKHQLPAPQHQSENWTAAPIQIIQDRFLYLGGRILFSQQSSSKNIQRLSIRGSEQLSIQSLSHVQEEQEVQIWDWFLKEVELGVEQSEVIWQGLYHPHH